MPRCLMLDVDGVLVTGRPEDGRFWAEDIERDLGIALDDLRALLFAPHWAEIMVGRRDLREVLTECLPRLAATVSVERFMDYWFSRDARVDRSVLAEVDQLRARGVAVFLATNQEHHRARHLMDRLGLGRHVDGIVHSARVGARKPEPAFVQAAAALAGHAARELLLVDDTDANVDAARQAGWQAERWTGAQSLSSLVTTR